MPRFWDFCNCTKRYVYLAADAYLPKYTDFGQRTQMGIPAETQNTSRLSSSNYYRLAKDLFVTPRNLPWLDACLLTWIP